ncbi:MAG: M20/M25/M40 family metallo-hydrolase [Ruminococcaceae bacterium]|nr:M20/M25/M40 family metallo-hydrolase [Oscillospiraceae bacterium]
MELTKDIFDYIESHKDEAFELLTTLAQIPAPSNHEEKRAEFCLSWLKEQGAEDVYIDDALNVVYKVGCDQNKPAVVYMAHSDVVFPDTDTLPLSVSDGKIYCPGVGDDTANVVALLMAAKYIAKNKITPQDCTLLLVVNSGEEGLGNLKGSRKIIDDFGDRIKEFITFDGYAYTVTNRAVGSKRFLVEIETEGGHSYSKFGNRNAIHILSSLVCDLYNVQVPEKGRTTYNVGTVSGGTSVNTIAQHAEMLYEFRSDERDSLEYMQKEFDNIIELYRENGVDVKVTLVGDRPCSGEVDPLTNEALAARSAAAVKKYYGYDVSFGSGSTDCNIPLSRGIVSACVGCVTGGGAHTREEYVNIESLLPGIRVAFDMILSHF